MHLKYLEEVMDICFFDKGVFISFLLNGKCHLKWCSYVVLMVVYLYGHGPYSKKGI